MLDSAGPFAHQQERVVPVWNIADKLGRRANDLGEVAFDIFAADGFRDVFDGDIVRDAIDLELDPFLVAEQHGTVVEQVEIGRGERVRRAWNAVEPRGDMPIRWRLDGDGDGNLKLAVEVQV